MRRIWFVDLVCPLADRPGEVQRPGGSSQDRRWVPHVRVDDVVCLKYFAGAVYPSRPTELACYWDILNQLATQADPPIASTLSIEQMRWEL
jgi:hypothetical protein